MNRTDNLKQKFNVQVSGTMLGKGIWRKKKAFNESWLLCVLCMDQQYQRLLNLTSTGPPHFPIIQRMPVKPIKHTQKLAFRIVRMDTVLNMLNTTDWEIMAYIYEFNLLSIYNFSHIELENGESLADACIGRQLSSLLACKKKIFVELVLVIIVRNGLSRLCPVGRSLSGFMRAPNIINLWVVLRWFPLLGLLSFHSSPMNFNNKRERKKAKNRESRFRLTVINANIT